MSEEQLIFRLKAIDDASAAIEKVRQSVLDSQEKTAEGQKKANDKIVGSNTEVVKGFNQLGVAAWKLSRKAQGVRLVALSWVTISSTADAHAEDGWRNLTAMARELDYTQEQFDAMIQQVAEGYKTDRGWGLIKAAFPEMEEG